MTRRRDLACEDLFGCTHGDVDATPISENGEIVAWVCACGKYTRYVDAPNKGDEEEGAP